MCFMQEPHTYVRASLRSAKTGYLMQLVVLDILGPFPKSKYSKRYIPLIAGYFTRWTEAYPTPDQEASTVAKKLTDEIFFRFSPPEQLHSDQGWNFNSGVIADMCKLLAIQKSRTTAYPSQSDWLSERVDQTLLSMLATVASE